MKTILGDELYDMFQHDYMQTLPDMSRDGITHPCGGC